MMTADPITVDAGHESRRTRAPDRTSGHNRLPVVEDGRLVGVVTRLDVLGALAA